MISTGDKNAVASRNGFSWSGPLVWRLKNWIDGRFMKRFSNLPVMRTSAATGLLKEFDGQMQCGGCGSKVSGDLLHEVLQNIGIRPNQLDDAAIFEVPNDKLMLHSFDSFRSFVADPFKLAEIAVQHALSDIYAMGGTPVTALASINVPFGSASKTRGILEQLLTGAKKALDAEGVALIGGHTTEGIELTIGFAVNGLVSKNAILKKSGMREGDSLILTKPLGTGILFAADMQYQSKGKWISAALESMSQSNKQAMLILQKCNATGCTDITGFGLGGHLLEMLRASHLSALLDENNLPVLDGAIELFHERGIQSTLHEGNQRSAIGVDASTHQNYPMLFDPQTSGGLLASVPSDQTEYALKALEDAGYLHARCIGKVVDTGSVAIRF